MKFAKIELDSKNVVTSNVTFPLDVSTCIISVPKIKYLRSNGDNFDLLKDSLKSDKVRNFLVDRLSNMNMISDILQAGHHNTNMVFIGATSASFDSYHEAILELYPNEDAASVMTLAVLLCDFMKQYGVIMDSPDWVMTKKLDISNKDDDILDCIIGGMVSKALATIPKRGRELSGRVPLAVCSQNILESFRGFVSELLTILAFTNDLNSLLARLRSYVLRESTDLYGDKARLFLEDHNFKTLAQNYTLVKKSLSHSGVASDATLWALEDARIVESLSKLEDQSSIEICSLNSLVKRLNILPITSIEGENSSVIIYPKLPNTVEHRYYRSLNSGQLTVFFGDTRLASLSTPLNKLEQISATSVSAMAVAISDKQTVDSKPTVYRLLGDWFDPDIYEYVAAYFSDQVYVDTQSLQFLYSLDISSVRTNRNIVARILSNGLTDCMDAVLLLKGVNVTATEDVNKSFYGVLENERYKYLFTDSSVYSVVDRDEKFFEFSYTKNKQPTKLRVDVDVFRQMFMITKGNYVATGLKPVAIHNALINACFEIISSLCDVANESYRWVDTYRSLLSIDNGMSKLAYQQLWRLAKDSKLDSHSLYTDIKFRLSVNEGTLRMLYDIFGMKLHDSFDKVLSKNIFAFTDLVRE